MALSIAERIALQKAKKATSPSSGSNNTIVPFKLKKGDNMFRIIRLKDSDVDYNTNMLKSESDTFMKIREWASGEFTAYNKPTRFKGLPYNGKKYPFLLDGDKFQETKSKLYGDSLKYGREYATALKQYNEAKASDDLTTFELQELREKVDLLKETELELKASSDRFYCDNNPRVYFLVIDRESNDVKYYSLSVKQYDLLEKAIEDGMLTNTKSTLIEAFMQLDNIKKLDKASASKLQKQLKQDLNSIKSLDELESLEDGLKPLAEKYDLTDDEIAEILDEASVCLDAYSEETGYDIVAEGYEDIFNGKPCIKLAGFKLEDLQSPAFESESQKTDFYKNAPSIMGDIFKILTPEFVEDTLEKMFDISSETKSSPKPVVTENKPPVKKEVTEPIPAKAKLTREVEQDFEEDEEIDDLPY